MFFSLSKIWLNTNSISARRKKINFSLLHTIYVCFALFVFLVTHFICKFIFQCLWISREPNKLLSATTTEQQQKKCCKIKKKVGIRCCLSSFLGESANNREQKKFDLPNTEKKWNVIKFNMLQTIYICLVEKNFSLFLSVFFLFFCLYTVPY